MPDIVKKSEEQKVAEAEVEGFRKDLGPFVVAADTTRMAMVFAFCPDNVKNPAAELAGDVLDPDSQNDCASGRLTLCK